MFVRMCMIIIQLTETSKGRDEDRCLMRLTFCLDKERRRKVNVFSNCYERALLHDQSFRTSLCRVVCL